MNAIGASMLALLIGLSSVSPVSAQQVITQCGPSSGKSFYVEPKGNGWVEDGIKNGSITFVRDKNGEYDVIKKHVGRTYAAREVGARVVLTHNEGGRYSFVVVYPARVVEVYQLTLDVSGQGLLLWSSMTNGVGVLGITTKAATFVSHCSK